MYDPATNSHRLTGIAQSLLRVGDRIPEKYYYHAPSNENLTVMGLPGENNQDPTLISVRYEYLLW